VSGNSGENVREFENRSFVASLYLHSAGSQLVSERGRSSRDVWSHQRFPRLECLPIPAIFRITHRSNDGNPLSLVLVERYSAEEVGEALAVVGRRRGARHVEAARGHGALRHRVQPAVRHPHQQSRLVGVLQDLRTKETI